MFLYQEIRDNGRTVILSHYYDTFDPYPGLFILGEAVEGADQIKDLSGTIHVEAAE